MAQIKRVGFVATGEEIIDGDIVNTNTAHFASQLKKADIQPGKQITVADDQNDIAGAIHYLTPDHHCIITIGGLGPTKDDVTRQGLAQALELPLKFYDEPWRWIEKRFAERDIPLTENNRQQAMLPQGSQAILNSNGSACACQVQHQGKEYFMLPGPPKECFPIFDDVVLPYLLSHKYQQTIFRKSWLLKSVSESKIADMLERIDHSGCEIGYRVSSPYLQIKLKSANKTALDKAVKQFEPLLSDKLADDK